MEVVLGSPGFLTAIRGVEAPLSRTVLTKPKGLCTSGSGVAGSMKGHHCGLGGETTATILHAALDVLVRLPVTPACGAAKSFTPAVHPECKHASLACRRKRPSGVPDGLGTGAERLRRVSRVHRLLFGMRI